MDPKERRGMLVFTDDRVFQEEKVNRGNSDLLERRGLLEKKGWSAPRETAALTGSQDPKVLRGRKEKGVHPGCLVLLVSEERMVSRA